MAYCQAWCSSVSSCVIWSSRTTSFLTNPTCFEIPTPPPRNLAGFNETSWTLEIGILEIITFSTFFILQVKFRRCMVYLTLLFGYGWHIIPSYDRAPRPNVTWHHEQPCRTPPPAFLRDKAKSKETSAEPNLRHWFYWVMGYAPR